MNNFIDFNVSKIYPSKIVCVGRNYSEHILELKNSVPEEMVIFNKPNSSISKDIIYVDNECQFETELSFIVIDDEFKGIGVGFDLTKRKIQSELKKRGLPWERSKSFDGSSVFSKFISIKFSIEDVVFKMFVNNRLKQEGKICEMINSPNKILKDVKSFMSFNDGDVLMTGTPKGVSVYNKNDSFRILLIVNGDILIDQEWIVK